MESNTRIANIRILLAIGALVYSGVSYQAPGKPVHIGPPYVETTTEKPLEQDGELQIQASASICGGPGNVLVGMSECADARLGIAATSDTALGAYCVSVKEMRERRHGMASRLAT